MAVERFRFRPRFAALAWAASGLGVAALGLAAGGMLGVGAPIGFVLGGLGTLLGPLHAASPAWRLAVELDDAGLRVVRGASERLALPWSAIVRVVWSPTTDTMFVDGGASDRSLLVPGAGAPAPYDLERKDALCRAILARVARERVTEVATLEEASR